MQICGVACKDLRDLSSEKFGGIFQGYTLRNSNGRSMFGGIRNCVASNQTFSRTNVD